LPLLIGCGHCQLNFAMIISQLLRNFSTGGSLSYYRACFLVVCALPAISAPALGQSQSQKPATVQQKPTASQQLQYSNQGTAQRNHTFDGTRPPPNPVHANPAPKPSPVGQPVYSSPGHPGYKPAPPPLHTNPVPLPASIARSTTTTPSPPPVAARSSTTATVPPRKP
jgi:hypothetical protein